MIEKSAGLSFDANFGFPTIEECEHTLKNGTALGYKTRVVMAIGMGHGGQGQGVSPGVEIMPTLTSYDYAGPMPGVAIGIGRDVFNAGKNAQMARSFSTEVQPPITAKGPGGGMHQWRTTNGEDVMPTLDTRLAAQVDKQMERNGSYLCGPM